MLAYQPDLPVGYDLGLTLLSIAAAVAITGARLVGRAAAAGLARRLLGGAIVGAGIGTMHYIGMSAVNVAGWIVWDETLRRSSPSLIGMALSAAAIAEHRRKPQPAALAAGLALHARHLRPSLHRHGGGRRSIPIRRSTCRPARSAAAR